MNDIKWKVLKRIGAFVLVAALVAGGQPFCSCADEPVTAEAAQAEQEGQAGAPEGDAAAQTTAAVQEEEEEIGPGVIPKIKPEELTPLVVNYSAYQDSVGWSEVKADNDPLKAAAGSFVSAIRMTISGQPEKLDGTLAYQVNVSGKGWLDWGENDVEIGAAPEQLPVEAVAMKLTGRLAEYYDIYYSVWQNGAWAEWAMNGAGSGAEGSGIRVEGLRAAAVVKGGQPPEIKPEGIDPTKPMVALTFDDGPSTPVTSRILDSLEANGGRATFFMVGSRVPGTHEVIQRMNALGCEVANHTNDHKYLTKIGDGGIRSQVGITSQKIAEACGVTPTLVRPPGGYYNQAALNTLGSMGMAAVMWNIDTLDWKTRNAQNTIDVVLNQVKDGDIVLMHDIYSTSADAAEVIIPELVKRGYQLVTVSEMAQYRGGIEAGHVYNRFRP